TGELRRTWSYTGYGLRRMSSEKRFIVALRYCPLFGLLGAAPVSPGDEMPHSPLFSGQLLQQLIDGLVHRLVADSLEPDHPLVVEDIDGRPAANVPGPADRPIRPLRPIPERPPGDLLPGHPLLQLLLVRVGVHADQGERLVLQAFHERPLVRVHGPAGASPVTPEVD